eukprot:7046325-Prorocentrum_lima.AAC.1
MYPEGTFSHSENRATTAHCDRLLAVHWSPRCALNLLPSTGPALMPAWTCACSDASLDMCPSH